jgi:hypothetical protein
VYAFRPEARFVPMLVAGGLLTLTAGALGFVTGLIKTFEAAGSAPDRGIALVGAGESLNCLGLAFALLAAALIATTIGTIRIARAPTTAA